MHIIASPRHRLSVHQSQPVGPHLASDAAMEADLLLPDVPARKQTHVSALGHMQL